MLELFSHNQKAYLAVANLLRETGKASVIHPTGTGKSYIAFKLCIDHPKDTVCWLSPSRYIFHVQLQNLEKTSGITLKNIQFYTYVKLAQMPDEELAGIQPAYIILDEFHRCGAEIWGKGVQNLLSIYPHAPVLGLSATNIRYLDNQRDMADELFDGNIASQMTLGQAIVQGILKPPVYVTALYRYQQNFEKLQKRVQSSKEKIVRNQGEKYLDMLKRALEKSQGLDRLFFKYIKDRAGKYIVFCASKEHMDEMVFHVPQWFGKIDAAPHVYCAYSNDPDTSKAFSDFIADRSGHLKLLFCIDMLNEGIHVEGVSGVILFRPTVSPIVFKQQIGRAMSAGSESGALILDIVDNISSLYSISAIQDEMQDAIDVYRSEGETEKIVNESFQIIDEVQDVRRIFHKLEDTLSAPWELMFQQAEKFSKENGNLDIPNYYVTPEGYCLGRWISTQRNIYRGSRVGNLSEEQIGDLSRIGMDWRSPYEKQWDQRYEEATAYYRIKHSLVIPYEEREDPNLQRLAYWLQRQRDRAQELTDEQKEKLNAVGMYWGTAESWNMGYVHAGQFYAENGHLDIPATYVSTDGYTLGNWYRTVRKQKAAGRLSEEQQTMLEKIGIQWDPVADRKWNQYYQAKSISMKTGILRYIHSTRLRMGFN